VPRLRTVDCSGPGIARRRRGRGFEYRDDAGNRIEDPEVLARIRELAIPPAWRDVWICPHPFGHIQATGLDAAGRKQYRYHDRWRERRDQQKFDEMLGFAEALPELRRRVIELLGDEGMGRERILACAVRLLDRGFFRIGSEDYAEQNESYGLATLRKSHLTIRAEVMIFDYPAKSGQRRVQSLSDPDVLPVVTALRRCRGGGDELLAYRQGRAWRDVRAADVNAFLREITGGDFSAKDFRTWNATVLAAVALAVSGPVAATRTGRKRAIVRAVREVAGYLGNTPAIARASYIDPRVLDRYRAGVTIGGALAGIAERDEEGRPPIQGPVERAVLDLLRDEDSPALEQVA
jgi:DNA topoisomerase I